MRRTRAVGLLVTLVFASATPVAQAPAGSPPPTAHASFKRAVILGKHRCLQFGEYCIHTRKANLDYHRYGFHCGKLDRRGRNHLIYY